MTAPAPQPSAIQRAESSPVLPVGLMLIGGYLVWFGVHYWRSDVKWPTDPVKAILTGKPLPDPKNTSDADTVVYYGKVLQKAPEVGAQAGSAASAAGGGSIVGSAAGIAGSNNKISADALKYVGAGYVFGGNASAIGKWDCSSFVSYVLGHDLGLPLPGGKWGDPGFPPHAHGPTTLQYLVYGSALNRSQVQAGDLVVWNTHMGIAISPSQIVAARTTATGTGLSTIDGVTAELGETPHFRRVAA